MLPCDLDKTREIAFHVPPTDQAEKAVRLLHGLDGIKASVSRPDVLTVSYNIKDFSLEGIESALIAQGFHLDNSLLPKLRRALAYFCERVQRENLAANVPDAKSQKVFAKVYEQHLHGDSDDTPEEWRAYK